MITPLTRINLISGQAAFRLIFPGINNMFKSNYYTAYFSAVGQIKAQKIVNIYPKETLFYIPINYDMPIPTQNLRLDIYYLDLPDYPQIINSLILQFCFSNYI